LAQLNVDADKLARQYQDKHSMARLTVLMFPHKAAHVHLTMSTITSRLPHMLRMAEFGPPLQMYVMTRNKWTIHNFDLINWPVHACTIKAHNKQRIHLTKMIHNVLPTNYHLHRCHPQRQKCPSCDCAKDEDRDHIMRCSSTA
jgi:hypothetical protein